MDALNGSLYQLTMIDQRKHHYACVTKEKIKRFDVKLTRITAVYGNLTHEKYTSVPTVGVAYDNGTSTCNMIRIPLETMEEPQIVRYKGGEEFSWHYDEVPPPQLPNGGQRVATLLVYLTDVPAWKGGGTAFRDLKESATSSSSLVMQPQMGSALLFFPSFADGSPDDRTLHKSEILKGDNADDDHKWIVQMWTHQREYQASLPIGNSNKAARDIMADASANLGYN